MRKNKNSKKIVLLIVIIFLLLLIGGTGVYFMLNNKGNKPIKINYNDYYSKYVTTIGEVKLYTKENDGYKEGGVVGSNVDLTLNNDNSNDGYFNVSDFDGKYYVYYKDIKKINELSSIDNRYKEYIVFNNNVVTKDKTEFYDENGNLVYSFNEGYSLPIIIKDTDRYGVEFNNRLLYIKSDEGEVINNTNTDKHNASGVGVFNYHAFYDENDPNDSCPTVICHSKKQFKGQLEGISHSLRCDDAPRAIGKEGHQRHVQEALQYLAWFAQQDLHAHRDGFAAMRGHFHHASYRYFALSSN